MSLSVHTPSSSYHNRHAYITTNATPLPPSPPRSSHDAEFRDDGSVYGGGEEGDGVGPDCSVEGREENGCGVSKERKLHRMRHDREYLLNTVCEELRKHDKYRCGLITASNFNLVMDLLGLEFDTPQVEEILQYCSVTKDGYVHYKYLALEVLPSYKTQAVKDNVSDAISCTDTNEYDRIKDPVDNYTPTRDGRSMPLTPDKSDKIRRLYAQWDRGNLKDTQLLNSLNALGLQPSMELKRLLSSHGKSLPFGKFMQVAMINQVCTSRRNRNAHPGIYNLQTEQQTEPMRDVKRDPVNWGSAGLRRGTVHTDVNLIKITPTSTYAKDETTVPTIVSTDMRLKQIVCDYLDGTIASTELRLELYALGTPITHELDSLIRSHDSDSSGQFSLFLSTIYRAQHEHGGTPRSTHRHPPTVPRARLEDAEGRGGGRGEGREGGGMLVVGGEERRENYRRRSVLDAKHDHGDIISWHNLHQPQAKAVVKSAGNNGDIIGWADPEEHKADEPQKHYDKNAAVKSAGHYGDLIGWAGLEEHKTDQSRKHFNRDSVNNPFALVSSRRHYPAGCLKKTVDEIEGERRPEGKKTQRLPADGRARCPFGTEMNQEDAERIKPTSKVSWLQR
eukprot:GHVQ01034072.1.p1 GENE.GHVQ01034072.1~~GHVQ01034072.1.p1  ORF type:complete len:618 (+),score=106.04 GHVQ01034072.1:699-2552(+)